MYKITLKNPERQEKLLHNPMVQDYQVLDPNCTLKINQWGSLTFKITSAHPCYNEIYLLKSEVIVYKDDVCFFTGRVVNCNKDFLNTKDIVCEGDLAYFVDTRQRAQQFEGSVEDFIRLIIKNHNKSLEKNIGHNQLGTEVINKEIKFGQIIESSNDVISNQIIKVSTNYETTWSTLNKNIIKVFGGYFKIIRVNGKRVLNYYHIYKNNNQIIEFGKNLLSLNQSFNAEQLVTAVIPLGCKLKNVNNSDESLSNTEERLNLIGYLGENKKAENDFILNDNEVNEYGIIYDYKVYDDAKTQDELYEYAKKDLFINKLLNYKLNVKAIDLNNCDVNFDEIKAGEKIKIISRPHNVELYLVVNELKVDLVDPSKNSISLTDERKMSQTDSLSHFSSENNVVDKVNEIESDKINKELTLEQDNTTYGGKDKYKTNFQKTPSRIFMESEYDYTLDTEDHDVKKNYNSSLDLRKNKILLKLNKSEYEYENSNGTVTNEDYSINSEMCFEDYMFKIKRTDNYYQNEDSYKNKKNKSIKSVLSYNALSFYDDKDILQAQFDSNRITSKSGEFANHITIGNSERGHFDLSKRNNGNLSIKWRD